MPTDQSAQRDAYKPTLENNVAEREEQIAAITARAKRLRPALVSDSGPTCDGPPEVEPISISVISRFDSEIPRAFEGGIMEPWEAQARASIAAALIVRGAVEVPSIPPQGKLPDDAGMRLRELTDYIYRLVTLSEP